MAIRSEISARKQAAVSGVTLPEDSVTQEQAWNYGAPGRVHSFDDAWDKMLRSDADAVLFDNAQGIRDNFPVQERGYCVVPTVWEGYMDDPKPWLEWEAGVLGHGGLKTRELWPGGALRGGGDDNDAG